MYNDVQKAASGRSVNVVDTGFSARVCVCARVHFFINEISKAQQPESVASVLLLFSFSPAFTDCTCGRFIPGQNDVFCGLLLVGLLLVLLPKYTKNKSSVLSDIDALLLTMIKVFLHCSSEQS